MSKILLNSNDKINKVLSNYSEHIVSYKLIGHSSKSVSHYYQAAKFIESNNNDIYNKIMNAENGNEAEKIGTYRYPKPPNLIKKIFFRNRYVIINPNWNEIKYQIMKSAIEAKVYEHYEVRNTLIGTVDNEILFESNNLFWGINNNGEGKNNFGRILSQVRDNIVINGVHEKKISSLLPPWKQFPSYTSVTIGWRMGEGEIYMRDFSALIRGLNTQEKEKYFNNNPEPSEWKNFYKNYI